MRPSRGWSRWRDTARSIVAAVCCLGICTSFGFAQNVVIVVVDGARYSETFAAESTYTPRIWNHLRPAGTIWTTCYNVGVTSTNPGHASIATGTWQAIANDGSQRPTMPTVFEYFRSASGAPQSEAYVVVGKPKLDVLSYSMHPTLGSAYAASVSVSSGDAGVIADVRSVMLSFHPRLIMVNLADVDAAGHAGVWTGYTASLRTADSLVYELWQTIQEDPFYGDSTTLFITNDHGRHDDAHGGFTNHGDGCTGCRHIMLLGIGRRIPSGQSLSTYRMQIDLAPTVGDLMGFETAYASGTSLLEDLAGTAVDVRGPGSGVRVSFELRQNAPNPFNPSTTIHFVLSEPGRAHLAVYDLLGRRVAVLLDDVADAGMHRVAFHPHDLPSGTYLYRLTADTRTETKKMLLVR